MALARVCCMKEMQLNSRLGCVKTDGESGGQLLRGRESEQISKMSISEKKRGGI